MEKRDNWFTDYQQIPSLGIAGMRQLANRISLFDVRDFSNRTVLDFGCNVGQMCFFAADHGASQVVGVDFDEAAFKRALKFKQLKPTYADKITFKLDDLDNPLFWNHVPMYDTTLFLSMIDTKELKNRFGMLSKAGMKARNVLYFEGHLKQSYVKYIKMLIELTDFSQIVYLGQSEGRPFFRCSRVVLDAQMCIDEIRASSHRHKRIAIVGNQLAGKTTLLQRLGQVEGFTIYDDCNNIPLLLKAEKIILADYRAGIYLDDFDVIFNLLTPPSVWERHRPNLGFTRSSPAREFTQLKELYTVKTY